MEQLAQPILRTSSKVCTKCGVRKDLTEFHRRPDTPDGRRSSCKACHLIATRAWEKANPEKIQAKNRKWRTANLDRHHENYSRWAKANPDVIKAKNVITNKKHAPAKRLAYHLEVYGKEVPISDMYHDRYRAARSLGFRSGLEVQLAKQLDDNHITYQYEEHTTRYVQPEEIRRFTPDFVLHNFIVVEGKGLWETADRKKLKLFRQQHPDVDLRMVFSNSSHRISKTSKTTYADVCRTLGIQFADKWIPSEWWREPLNEKSKAALEKACRAS